MEPGYQVGLWESGEQRGGGRDQGKVVLLAPPCPP